MKAKWLEEFYRNYHKLPVPIQKKTQRVITYLMRDLRHPGVRAKKVVNHLDIWEARVDIHHRMTFKIEADVLVFRRVGLHDILKNP